MADKIARSIEMEDAEYFLALWRHQRPDTWPPVLGTQSPRDAILVFFDSCGDGRDEGKFLGVFRSGMRTFSEALPACRDMKPRQRATLARAEGESLTELWNSLRERCGLHDLPAKSEPGRGRAGRVQPPSVEPGRSPALPRESEVTLPPTTGADDPPEPADNRNWTLRLIADRRGQTAFRDDLFKRFGNKCIMTGCDLPDALEAAHIKPYAGELGDQDLDNGLLLRADIHTLFDLHLVGVSPDTLAVEWHPRLVASSHFRHLTAEPVSVVTTKGERLRDSALRERYARFREHFGQ